MSSDEFDLISWIQAQVASDDAVLIGIGDDAAQIEAPSLPLLLKVDSLVEGVHFQRRSESEPYFLNPKQIGAKAIKRAISDIAAMAGTPRYALVAGTLPPDSTLTDSQEIMHGILEVATSHAIQLVGGETTIWKHSPVGGLVLSITLVGESGEQTPTRSAAKKGDAIFITGELGDSHLGHHYAFTPRVQEGKWLGEFGVNAMMDVSDGLASDLLHISKASRVGLRIDLEKLPLRSRTQKKDQTTLTNAFSQGEDYELVLTIDSALADQLLADWPFETELTMIGNCSKAISGVEARLYGEAISTEGGWRPRFVD